MGLDALADRFQKMAGENDIKGMFSELLSAVRGNSINISDWAVSVNVFKAELAALSSELISLKADVVSKSEFQSLVDRVQILATSKFEDPALHFCKQSLVRLDPSNKALRFTCPVELEADTRTILIDKFIAQHSPATKPTSTETIFKGKGTERTATKATVVEFVSRQAR